MDIKELKPNLKEITLENVEVMELSPVKEFSRMGKAGRVCNAIIKDESGEVSLTLWNEEIDKVSVGTKLNVKNGYVKEWQGNMQVNTGRNGELEVINP